MSALLSIRAAGLLVGARDPRTITKRLGTLGVSIVEFDGHRYVDEADVLRARRALSRPLEAGAPTGAAGARLAPQERLWDGRPNNQVAPRRVSARGRGDRELALQAAHEAYPAGAGASADRSSRSS
jgi:hypothetical protein